MTQSQDDEEGMRVLILKLLESGHRDIFYRLCVDIVASTARARSEQEAVSTCLSRTWRWHHLLRGGGDGRLTLEEQKGLIGELIVLEQIILRCLAPADAVATWHGPTDSPKDFEIGRICIEAKARRGAATPHVVVSSEHQLDASGIDLLFLHVVELDRAPSPVDGALTLTEVARHCQAEISSRDSWALEPFESLLAATGFRWEDDYGDTRWIQGSHRMYRVEDTFPALTAEALPTGVSNVRYSISLRECEAHRVTDEYVIAALSGDHDGH